MIEYNKGANYVVYVTEFYGHNGERMRITSHHYFHRIEGALKTARAYAKQYGCGEFEDTDGEGGFWLQATSDAAWVGVQEIRTED